MRSLETTLEAFERMHAKFLAGYTLPELRILYGRGASRLTRQQLLNRILKRDLRQCAIRWHEAKQAEFYEESPRGDTHHRKGG